MNKIIKAFTLVELIVVITILAILGTIGFVSLQGYSLNARDSVRISDTKTFIKALNIYQTKNGEVPLPDDVTTITGSGVVFSYQGTLSGSVVTALGQGQVPLDPSFGIPYIYATNPARTQAQLLSYQEKNITNLDGVLFPVQVSADFEDSFPHTLGDDVGIILHGDNTPISGSGFELIGQSNIQMLLSSSQDVESDIDTIYAYLNYGDENYSCREIYETSKTPPSSGVYQIYDANSQSISVYCDMETAGGGWTLVLKADGTKTNFQPTKSIWTDSSVLNEELYLKDNNQFKSRLFSTLSFDSILLGLKGDTFENYMELSVSSNSLQTLFSGEEILTDQTRQEWFDMIPGSYLQTQCNKGGINVTDPDQDIIYARIGFMGNNGVSVGRDKCYSPDSFIGIGLPRNGAAAGNSCGSTMCANVSGESLSGSANFFLPSQAYIFIR